MLKITPSQISTFRRTLRAFFTKNRRDLSWRRTHDPYKILVSEIMLQQTQVSRVLEKYKTWLKVFPNLHALAGASLSEVLKEWKGLGYNRRGLALYKIAQTLVHEGRLIPRTYDELVKLPGIGPNTAGSILAFAFDEPTVFIETNIRTVFIHHFGKGAKKISDDEIRGYVKATLDRKNPREWYYALMDYGVHLKKTVGNKSRESATYRTQSRFKGSNRELRAAILFALRDKPRAENWLVKNVALELAHSTEAAATKVSENLAALSREGFIEKVGESWRVK